jgi:putative DNA primase/helicase
MTFNNKDKDKSYKEKVKDILGGDDASREKRGKLIYNTAQELMQQYAFQTMRDNIEQDMYVYRDGVYIHEQGEIAEFVQRNFVETDIAHLASNSLVTEVCGHVQRSTLQHRSNFDANPNLLVVENGILNLETGKLQSEHTPEHLSVMKLPVRYDEDAKAPEIEKFLDQVTDGKDSKTYCKIVKMLGDILQPDYRYQSLYFLTGAGANGKGTLLRLIVAFVTQKYASGVRLQTLASDPFAAADLYGKFVNVAGDVDAEEDIKDWALIRTLTGGDLVRVHRKYGQPFDLINRAKLICAFNRLPEVDTHFATFRRLVLIPLERVFEGDDRDLELDAKLQTPEEMSGLLNLALQGLQWLREDQGYTDESWVQVREQYLTLQNEIKGFVNDKFIVDANGKVDAEKLRQKYHEWANMNNKTPLDNQQLGEKLAALGFENKQNRRTGVRYYHGLKLRSDAELDKILGGS